MGVGCTIQPTTPADQPTEDRQDDWELGVKRGQVNCWGLQSQRRSRGSLSPAVERHSGQVPVKPKCSWGARRRPEERGEIAF